MDFSNILVRATNWVGDAVMSLPALRAIRERFPRARITVLALAWVADLYARERFADRVILYHRPRWRMAAELRRERFDCAILLPNSFDAALTVWLVRIPERIGYSRDGRGMLLTRAIPVPEAGAIPRHQRFYYLEMLRRAGIVDQIPAAETILLEGAAEARAAGELRFQALGFTPPFVGISPGAAYGNAKRWLPERFAEAADALARPFASIAVFGSAGERPRCEEVARRLRHAGHVVHDFAGETTLGEFIEMAAAASVFLTNDSGAMHIASALGVPTVAIFGATDEVATGPSGPLTRVVREPVECAPCLLRECPIDHRCMTRVSAERVAQAALELLK